MATKDRSERTQCEAKKTGNNEKTTARCKLEHIDNRDVDRRAHMWTARNVASMVLIRTVVVVILDSRRRRPTDLIYTTNAQNLSYSLKVNEFDSLTSGEFHFPVHRAISPTMCGVS